MSCLTSREGKTQLWSCGSKNSPCTATNGKRTDVRSAKVIKTSATSHHPNTKTRVGDGIPSNRGMAQWEGMLTATPTKFSPVRTTTSFQKEIPQETLISTPYKSYYLLERSGVGEKAQKTILSRIPHPYGREELSKIDQKAQKNSLPRPPSKGN